MNLDQTLCSTGKGSRDWSPFLIVVVHSEVKNFRLRQKVYQYVYQIHLYTVARLGRAYHRY